MGWWARIRYRLWQLGQNLTARPLSPHACAAIATLLSPAEQNLFYRFSHSDQRHSYRVLRLLQEQGHHDSALLAAALLHDIGKTQVTLHWWERVFIVVGVLAGSERYHRWGQGEPEGWRKSLVVRIHHPAWGADMAEAIGSDPLTVTLIRRHQEKLPPDAAATPENDLLRLLQWADDQS